MAQGIDLFYQKCDPAEPLENGDERYVPCDDVRGSGDVVARMGNAIRRSDRPMHLLFTGHRGCGKSTELKRLIARLSKPAGANGESRPLFVVYFEADREDIDVNDVDVADVLLAIVRELGRAMRLNFQYELRPTYLNRFLDDMKHLLGSEVSFDKLELDAKIAKFTALIYTLPISMLFSPTATALTTIYSKQPFTLPMIKVMTHDRLPNPAGMEAMRQIVQKRLTASSIPSDEAFYSPDTLNYLCEISGGHLRNMLVLIRSACDYVDALPLGRTDVEKAVAQMRTDYERALNKPEFYEVLRKVDETLSLPGSPEDQVLMFNTSILEYLNGEACYTVNPVVRTLRKFLAAPAMPAPQAMP